MPPLLTWSARDPESALDLLAVLGLRRLGAEGFLLPPAVLEVRATDDPADTLAITGEVDADVEVGDAVSEDAPRLVALGWASVDAARAAAAFERPLAGDAIADAALGAAAYALAGEGRLSLLLLEPVTEGRIAAALARNGEGPVALYVEGAALPDEAVMLVAAPTGLGRPGRLVRPSAPSGPYVILLG